MQPFFQSGQASVDYSNIRDEPDFARDKAFVECLWRAFAPYADPDFLRQAKRDFVQRFWEMYLWSTLLSWGLNPKSTRGNGLDFCVELQGTTTWFEANAPKAGTGADAVKESYSSEFEEVPYDSIILRLTNAASGKLEQYRRWRNEEKVARDDPFVIALNVYSLPHTLIDSTLPLLARAFLGAGGFIEPVKTEKDDKRKRRITRKAEVLKLNRSSVETTTLLSDEYRDVSGILASRASTSAYTKPFGYDFLLLCNPRATHPVPDQISRRCARLVLRNDELYKIAAEGRTF